MTSPPSVIAVRAIELPPNSATIGALYVGWGISMLGFGIFCLQAVIYFTRYVNDSRWRKLLVSFIALLEITHQVVIGHACWQYIVRNFGDAEETFVSRAVWSFSAVVFLNVLVSAVVKIFLGWRIYIISNGCYWWLALISIMAVTQMSLGISFSVEASQQPVNSLFALKSLATAALAIGAATDLLTAAVLTYYLHTMRTGYAKTEGIINKLIMFSVNTGAITSAFSLSVVILFQLMPHNFIFAAIWFFVSKLYSNSCLATLNSRSTEQRGKDAHSSSDGVSHALSIFRPRSRTNPVDLYSNKESQPPLHISVSQEVSVVQDDKCTLRGALWMSTYCTQIDKLTLPRTETMA
ncbi:unnamed protein product [Peniophora sp. CBMAI 1063]|nr:unnamed protein product [Peniophora sp. CBMAI 1063]